MNFSIKSVIATAILMMTLLGRAENVIYSQSDLSSTEGLRCALTKKYPGVERIYELFDKKRGREITVYFDKRTSKAIVIFGGNDVRIKCHVDENEIADHSDVFESEEVLAFAQNVHYSNDGKRRIYDNKNSTISFSIGYSFRRPKAGLLKISLSSTDGNFLISWNEKENCPDITLVEEGGAERKGRSSKCH
jgi:hypothetical protein